MPKMNQKGNEDAPNQFDVAIVGEINTDLIVYGPSRELPEEREILASGFTLTLGSSSGILAHNLSLLATKVSFSSRIGSDVLGEICCQKLAEAGVDLSHVVRSSSAGRRLRNPKPLPY
jgi:sugar/nucleoside kinase (ribokinase family)